MVKYISFRSINFNIYIKNSAVIIDATTLLKIFPFVINCNCKTSFFSYATTVCKSDPVLNKFKERTTSISYNTNF